MATNPTGMISLPLGNLRTSLANCSTFRLWTGVATVEQALARIYFFGVPSTDKTRPYAMVGLPKIGTSKDGAGQPDTHSSSAQVALRFVATRTPASDLADEIFPFTNKVGAIWAELCEMDAELDGRFDFGSSESDGVHTPDKDEFPGEQDCIEMVITFSYIGSPVS
ncbi:hypothetical protein AMJ85_12020 [candidate division BRC1 bacterium SM23_51]|nr:MAG: hypothetical protein AMJ85_12020 [candidate division BRC1 bacterium SM23_51]